MERKILHGFYWFVIATFLAICIMLFLSSINRDFVFKFLTVRTGSMEPAIPQGSLVVVKPEKEYNPGDVVTFRYSKKDDQTVTHRILGIEKQINTETFLTKGDANEEKDLQPVVLENIVGKVVIVLPFAGYILSFTRQPIGLAVVIIIPALLFIAGEITTIKKEISHLRRKVSV